MPVIDYSQEQDEASKSAVHRRQAAEPELTSRSSTSQSSKSRPSTSLSSSCGGFFWTFNLGRADYKPEHAHATNSRTHLHILPPTFVSEQPDKDYMVPAMPLLPLDAKYQAYFFRMQRISMFTSDPNQIRGDAQALAEAVLVMTGRLTKDKLEYSLRRLATRLYWVAIIKPEYSLSVALLVHYIIAALKWKSWRVAAIFHTFIVNAATEPYVECCKKLNTLSFTSEQALPYKFIVKVNEACEQLTRTCTFIGDLFALAVLPSDTMHRLIPLVLNDPRSETHCRALYLLFLRASPCIGLGLGNDFLKTCRQTIVWRMAYDSRPFYKDLSTRRLMQEICNTIDRMYLAYCPRKSTMSGVGPPLIREVYYKSDPGLSDSIVALLDKMC